MQCPDCRSDLCSYNATEDKCFCVSCFRSGTPNEFQSRSEAERIATAAALAEYESHTEQVAAACGMTPREFYESAMFFGTFPKPARGEKFLSRNEFESSVRLLGDRVLIRADKPEEKSAGGLIIPDTAQNKATSTWTGTVVACGPGDRKGSGSRHDMHVSAGERIVYSRNRTCRFEEAGEEYEISHEQQHILAVLD